MNRYKVTKQLGDGTYGSVLKAVNRQTGEVVAVKKVRIWNTLVILGLEEEYSAACVRK